MSDQFYSYLSNKIINFFRQNPLKPGSKYNIQFEKEEQVRALFEELKDNTLYREYEYKDKDGNIKYKSYQLDFNGVSLIVSSTMDGVQPDFLTRLRNMVGLEAGYEKKAILFIHNTTLDSIMGGTESFSKEGMPFHIDSIQKSIKSDLVSKPLSDVDKAIIEMDLERKKNTLFTENNSIFEYKEVLDIINKGSIEQSQYKDFGLFYDKELKDLSGKELKKRIKDNASYFTKVDEIHNYGNPDTQLEKYFDDKGIMKLKEKGWKDEEYSFVRKSVEDKIAQKPLEYKGCNQEWDKEEGTSKVKSRVRNIIVFNESDKDTVDLEFTFDEHLKSQYIGKTEGEASVSTSGKKLKVTIEDKEGKSNFYKVIYKVDNVKFEFKIAMFRCSAKYFDAIKSKYSIVMKKKESYISINTNDSEIVFNEFKENNVTYEIDANNDVVNLKEDEKLTVKISDNFEYENDSHIAKFNIKVNNEIIPIGVEGTNEKISVIEGFKVWKLKREKNCDFKIIGDNKLQHGTKEYFTRDEFRKNLEIEKQIIDLGGIAFIEDNDGIILDDIDIDSEVKIYYENILEYYRLSNKLPSLSHLSDELSELYEKFIKVYINALNNIQEGSYLTKKEKQLFKIGTIKREIGEHELLFTPLHPLNIAYQLHLNNEIDEDDTEESILKKFTSTYLLPYIIDEDDKLYIPIEQQHSPEWKYYVDEKLPRYKSSRDFVSKLVTEKIEEFVGHFKYMFDMGNNAPIRINLINTGDSKEILQGVFKYYTKQLRKNEINKVLPIDLFIYSDKNITNAFEEVAFNEDIESLKEIYNLDLSLDSMSEEDVLSLYREKVQFYSKNMENGIEYAHITFLEMNNEVKKITSNMNDIPTGIIMKGMISGVPSVFLGDSYRTGFGTKYLDINKNLMNIAKKLNALNTAFSGEPFNSNQCKAISVPNKSKLTLDSIYNSSHWISFINPKVDLNFFKNDPDAKDLLIIHYSDQYTTAGGYDAITVTRKSGPYQRIIEEFLSKNKIENAKEYSPSVINMFNAINGDWLLRLLSSKSHFPKEKISILSAIKLGLAKFKNENITWVPISLEEVLRVSGGAGLKQSEGFLSAKNLGFDNGVTSDDILFVGIEEKQDNVYVHYYPVEVKIGINETSYINKGIEQAKATKNIFDKTLLPDENGDLTNTQKVYRNFLMQLVVTSAEKLNLYSVCTGETWDNIINSDLRRKLLNEEYYISNSLEKSLGKAAVISFKKGSNNKYTELKDDVMLIEMSEDDGIQFITKSVEEIREYIGNIDIKPTDVEIEHAQTINNDKDILDINIGHKQNNKIVDRIISTITPDIHEVKECKVETKGSSEERNMEILFGVNQKNNKKVYWYPNDTDKVFHTNTGIIGTMGTGKTQFTKSMITQIYRESKYNVDGKDVGILIFDYKGDYNKSKKDFIEATNANVYELYRLPFNPLSVIRAENSKPMLPLHTANSLKVTLAKAFGLGIKQETLLRDLIMEAYDRRGIIKNDSSTWDLPAPTLKDVYDIYVNREDLKEDSLYAAFSNLIDFEIFEPDPLSTKSLFDLINGVIVIDLSGYDSDIQNLVVAITLDLFYSQMQAFGHSKVEGSLRQLNKIILVDEADNFLSKNFETLKKILKEGREFGVGTILSTQLLSHFSTGEHDYANYILTWIVHNVAEISSKDAKFIFNAQAKSDQETICNKIKSLNKHYSLVKMGDSDRAIFMKDRAFWELKNI